MAFRRMSKRHRKNPPSPPRRDEVSLPTLSRGWQGALVAGLLLLYFIMAVSASTRRTTTFDETLHLPIGYVFWTHPNYPIAPENGIFAQAWAALPLLADDLHASVWDQAPRDVMDNWKRGYQFFFQSGNDPDEMLVQARAMIALLGVALGALIYFWSRELFGIGGGLISLVLFAFCPMMLAHGALVTADLAVTLGFAATLYAFWKLSHRVSSWNLIFSLGALSFLLLTKMSSILILPMLLVMALVRLLSSRGVEIRIGGVRTLAGWQPKICLAGILFAAHLICVMGALWLAYNFKYTDYGMASVRNQILSTPTARVGMGTEIKTLITSAMSGSHLFPPAYMEGLSYTLITSETRSAFLCGQYSLTGWWWFFPFAFLIKTPLPILFLLLSAFAALAWWKGSSRTRLAGIGSMAESPSFYALTPLLILGGIYGVTCLTSHLNIGLRHLLPLYPFFFILAGANVFWLRGHRPVFTIAVGLLLAWLVVDSLAIRPSYLAFFNQLVGGPSQGYRYLVDSSLDWGQDLPALRDWLAKKSSSLGPDESLYLSYLGTASPDYYGIHARRLPGEFDFDPSPAFPLRAGIYCISATMLQTPPMAPGPWSSAAETTYEQVRGEARQWDSTARDPAARQRLLQERGADFWNQSIQVYLGLRFSRLCAYLRLRAPDAEAGYSILIYRLSNDDIARALNESLPVGLK